VFLQCVTHAGTCKYLRETRLSVPHFLSLNRTLPHAFTIQVRTTTTTLRNKEAEHRGQHCKIAAAMEATGTCMQTERKTKPEMIAEAGGGKMRRVTWETSQR
jgi:hypothetical protein